MAEKRIPPPLPSRQHTTASSTLSPERVSESCSISSQGSGRLSPPPPYAVPAEWAGALHSGDPRTSSTQSLSPSSDQDGSKRKLLIVYLHGFYGNDQSFGSFPAHLHALLASLLSETHVIHSKIYPRYKTYRAIEIARDNFCAWLEPHESPTTDVVLVGHSMGGLLAAEVVLMRNYDPSIQRPFKHRILGTLSLDSPFLGLHPGIVVSGIASLFSPAAADASLQDVSPALVSIPSSVSVVDTASEISGPAPSISTQQSTRSLGPHYDAPFFNDQPFREQPFVKRMMNFTSKHRAEGLFNAMGNHIMSHLEFGGCLADYPGMSARYKRLRALEDVDEVQTKAEGHPDGAFARVRFVNYYTLCSGRPKQPKPTVGEEEPVDISALSLQQSYTADTDLAQEGYENLDTTVTDDDAHSTTANEDDGHELPLDMLEPEPIPEDDVPHTEELKAKARDPESEQATLAPIPDPPTPPTLPDLSQITDKDLKKQAEKEAKRLQRAYEQAQKDREKAIREREKLIDKMKKRDMKAAQKAEKATKKELELEKKTSQKEVAAEIKAAKKEQEQQEKAAKAAAKEKQPKLPKLRKFCVLPSKVNGVRDETWVDIYMTDVDEVGAHCGLFLPGPHYEPLIAQAGELVVRWVQDDLSAKAALSMVH